ncbi:MAG: hypothetical protein JWN98_519 [Abditibacteriota bacterium]|nr:hypothetical protein [Abditibacteriota bacterium]
MLFVVVIIAFVMYCGLYLLWESAHTQLDGTASILRALSHMLLMPQEAIFVILRGLIILTFLYAIADFVFSSAKRIKRRRPITQVLRATFNEDDSHTRREL